MHHYPGSVLQVPLSSGVGLFYLAEGELLVETLVPGSPDFLPLLLCNVELQLTMLHPVGRSLLPLDLSTHLSTLTLFLHLLSLSLTLLVERVSCLLSRQSPLKLVVTVAAQLLCQTALVHRLLFQLLE